MSDVRIITEEDGAPKLIIVDGVALPYVFDVSFAFNLRGKSILRISRYKSDSREKGVSGNGVKPLTICEDFLLDSLVIKIGRKEI